MLCLSDSFPFHIYFQNRKACEQNKTKQTSGSKVQPTPTCEVTMVLLHVREGFVVVVVVVFVKGREEKRRQRLVCLYLVFLVYFSF